MPKKDLDEPDIGTALVKVSSKAVPQNMCSHPLIETGMLPSFAASLLQRGDVHRIIWIAPRKQPMARSGQTPVGPQDAEQPRRRQQRAPRTPSYIMVRLSFVNA